jgi:hypothetical protein
VNNLPASLYWNKPDRTPVEHRPLARGYRGLPSNRFYVMDFLSTIRRPFIGACFDPKRWLRG